MASGGILVLDEMNEFKKSVLEALRQPLEDRVVRITRAMYRLEYQADTILVGTSNPCPCGYAFEKNCRCTATEQYHYQKKLSGPILDRIDLYVEMKRLTEEELLEEREQESSKEIKKRVLLARKMQERRYENCFHNNAKMTQEERKKYCALSEEDKIFLKKLLQNWRFLQEALQNYYQWQEPLQIWQEEKNWKERMCWRLFLIDENFDSRQKLQNMIK